MKGKQVKQYMIDIEALGTSPYAVVTAIGLVYFDEDKILDERYWAVDMTSQPDRDISPQTVKWWLEQSKEAQDAMLKSAVTAEAACLGIQAFYKRGTPCWAKGSTFDHTIIQSLFESLNLKNPIHHREQWCMRGLMKITNTPPPKREGTHHNALDDAKHQAEWVQRCLAQVKKGNCNASR